MNNRLSLTKDMLSKYNLDGMLVSSIPNITYLTNYSGFSSHEREAYLLITEKNNYIFTDGRYSEAIVKDFPHFTLQEIAATSPFTALLKMLIGKHNLQSIGFEEDDLSVQEYNKLHKIHKRLKPLILTELRIHKAPEEIAAIKKACAIGDKAFSYILKQIKSGVTEKELGFKLEMFIKQQGADLSFPLIVAFGANSSVPHHQSGSYKLKANGFVLLDFGVKFDNYCSDMTRTVFFGKPDDKQKKMYQTVLEAQQKAINFINSSYPSPSGRGEGEGKMSLKVGPSSRLIRSDLIKVNASEVDRIARDYIISQGFPSIPHSLGHGIGLEVHEAPSLSPKSKQTLKNGMVFSIEPGIYLPALPVRQAGGRQGLPGFGGVRIEDLFTIQNSKLLQLTHSPRQLIEINTLSTPGRWINYDT